MTRHLTLASSIALVALIAGCEAEDDGTGGSTGSQTPTGPASGSQTATNGSNGSSQSGSGNGSNSSGAGSSSSGGGVTSCANDVENLTPVGDGGVWIDAFPACIGFASNAYQETYGLVWLNEGATHEYVPDAGWDGGGAARFTPPTPTQAATGLGQLHIATTHPSHLSMRWLMKVGPTMGQHAYGNKTTIFVQDQNDASHPRPMIITRQNPAVPNAFVPAPCDGTVCKYHGAPDSEPWWPDGSDTFWLGGEGGYQEQWVSWEFESDLNEGWIRLYISTTDGAFNDTLYVQNDLIDEASVTGGTFAYIDFVGGYFMDGVVADPGNWFEIDEIVISDQHIGPPEGFVQ